MPVFPGEAGARVPVIVFPRRRNQTWSIAPRVARLRSCAAALRDPHRDGVSLLGQGRYYVGSFHVTIKYLECKTS